MRESKKESKARKVYEKEDKTNAEVTTSEVQEEENINKWAGAAIAYRTVLYRTAVYVRSK